jgi:hypothetical protein
MVEIVPEASERRVNHGVANSMWLIPDFPLSLRRQVLHDQLLLNLPRAGRQQGYVVVAVRCEEPAIFFTLLIPSPEMLPTNSLNQQKFSE